MYKKIFILLILLLTGCSNSITNRLIISDINIDNEISISSINDDVKGIVMFSEYGRPNIENTNTVIGAHSGYGNNAYFNNLKELKIGDNIELIYDNFNYTYIVINKLVVDKKEISILDNKGYTSLTLMTCDNINLDNRVIIIAKQN